MKTAISLPNALFEKADQAAQYMGISRSKLFVNALEEYIIRHNGEMITQKVNEVYEKINPVYSAEAESRGSPPDDFSRDLDIGIVSLRELTKNDAW